MEKSFPEDCFLSLGQNREQECEAVKLNYTELH